MSELQAGDTHYDKEKLSNSSCLVLDQNRIRKIMFEIMNMASPFFNCSRFCPSPTGSTVRCWNTSVMSRNDTTQQRHTKQDKNFSASQNKSKSSNESKQDENNEKESILSSVDNFQVLQKYTTVSFHEGCDCYIVLWQNTI